MKSEKEIRDAIEVSEKLIKQYQNDLRHPFLGEDRIQVRVTSIQIEANTVKILTWVLGEGDALDG